MSTMLSVMRECRNFFEVSSERGVFSIAGGVIDLKKDYPPGSHILITGSYSNDGVYLLRDKLYTLDGACDESDFQGIIYGLRVPKDFLELCDKIDAFCSSDEGKNSGIVSESVSGVHSYTLAVGKNGVRAGWRTVFASELTPFRKMFTEVLV